MNKLEITINKAEELIFAMTRLALALESKHTSVQVTVDEPVEMVDQEKEEPPIAPKKPVTLVQIRAVLTAKSQAGKKAAFGELFKKYDADKLSAVDPTRYADFFKDVEAL